MALLAILCLLGVLLCITLIASRDTATGIVATRAEVAPARIDVNRAGTAELSALPGIGEKKAERIIQARHERSITSLEDLARAAGGIPKSALERMRPFVAFGNEATASAHTDR